MRFASAITNIVDTKTALVELLSTVESRLTPGMVDLVLLFVTAHFEDDLDEIVEWLGSRFPHAIMIGCSAEGTVGGDRECERVPSMSIMAGELPGVTLRPFHINKEMLDNAYDVSCWERLVGVSPDSEALFVAFADPFRFHVADFVEQLNEVYPGVPLVGGIASAGSAPYQNRLIVDGRVEREGVVGVAMTGSIRVQTVVSQGCRPIGQPFVITRGERNIIHDLGGHPALKQLHNVLMSLDAKDEQLARQSLFVGRVIDEHRSDFRRGDFLIQNILGVDRKTGALGIAGQARAGSTVQFHVRDSASADEDLRAMLSEQQGQGAIGALLFSCNGRGSNMWSSPNHDISVVQELLGEIPVAGFFCAGEFGPIGGSNFIHAFTASIALLHGAGQSSQD